MDNLIKVINERIEDRGMTIKAVGVKADINPDLLSRTLIGKRKLKADELIGLCKVLDLTLDDFRAQARAAS
nr:MAG TPA: Helix-turn-helix XRE-family like protein [Caudoviricetes sp.]